MALKFLFEFETSSNTNANVALIRINKFNLFENSVKINDYDFVKKVLTYMNFNVKDFRYKKIFMEAFKNNLTCDSDKNVATLLIKSFMENYKESIEIPLGEQSNETINEPSNELSNELTLVSKKNEKYNQKYLNLILNIAIKVGNFNFVKYIVDSKDFKCTPDDINTSDLTGEYPIFVALSNKKLEIFEYLLNKGADYNSENNNGIPLIFLTIYLNDLDYVCTLLNDETYHKVNLDILDKNGYTPLIQSYIKNNMDIFNYLLKYSDFTKTDVFGNDLLYYIIQKNDINNLKKLIDMGVMIDNNIMDFVINKNHFNEILEYENIPLDYKNKNEEPLLTSLILSNINNKEECIKQIVERGCNVNAKDKNGNIPLYYAMSKLNTNITQLLIKHGANINIKNYNMESLLFSLIKSNISGLGNFFEILFENGCNIDEADIYGNTPLIQAVKNNNLKYVRLLVNNGANKNIKNNYGNTAKQYIGGCYNCGSQCTHKSIRSLINH